MDSAANTVEPTKKIHPFELAGLGKAPFRFVGQHRSVYQACPGAPIQPGSSCDYCGTGISEVYMIRSADGRTFKVGCDCVAKTCRDAATTEAQKLAAAVDSARRKANREKAHAKAAVQKGELATLLADAGVCLILQNAPHPTGSGSNLLDYAVWMSRNAGASGRAKTLKLVKDALKNNG